MCLQQALAERNGGGGGEGGEHDDSEEDAKGMARLFAEVGEAYTGLIAEGGPQVRGAAAGSAAGARCRCAWRRRPTGPPCCWGWRGRCSLLARPPGRRPTRRRPPAQVSAPVEALLDVASHPDDSICSMSFNFWHRLARALTIGLHPEPLGAPAGGVLGVLGVEHRQVGCRGVPAPGLALLASTPCRPACPSLPHLRHTTALHAASHSPTRTRCPPRPDARAESEEGPVSDEERQRRVQLFTPTLERLVALIRGRVRFTEGFDAWHRDERQDFKRAR